MKDNAHLYWPAMTAHSKSQFAAMQPVRPKVLAVAVASVERLDGANGIGHARPLRDQHIHLAQLRDDLLRLVSLPRHIGPP